MTDTVTIESAYWGDETNASAVIVTRERGAIAINLLNRPLLWAQFQHWIAAGGVPAPCPVPGPKGKSQLELLQERVALLEAAIAKQRP